MFVFLSLPRPVRALAQACRAVLLLAVRASFPHSAPWGLAEVLQRCESFPLAVPGDFGLFFFGLLLVVCSILTVLLSTLPIGADKVFLKLKFRLDGNIFEKRLHLCEGFFFFLS